MKNDIATQESTLYKAPSIFEVLIASLLFTLSFFFSAPLNLMALNPAEFEISLFPNFIFRMLAFCSLSFILVFIVSALLSRYIKHSMKVIYGILIAITVWLHYSPVSIGQLDGVEKIASSPIAIITGIVFGAVFILLHKYAKIVFWIMSVGPLLTALVFFVPFALKHESPVTAEVIPLSSNAENFLILSFDSVEADTMTDVLKRRPDLAARFDGFTAWKNNTAVAPFTLLSTRTTKLGFLPDGDIKDFEKDHITHTMADKGYGIETFGWFGFGEGDVAGINKLPDLAMIQADRDEYYQKALNAVVIRIAPYVSLKIQKSFNKFFNFLGDSESEIARAVANDIRPNTMSNKLDIQSFRGFIDTIDAKDGKPTLRLHHYVFPHYPDTFDADCNYIPGGTDINQLSLDLAQTQCLAGLMADLVDNLKEMGVYDNTAIFFTSDHGKECPYNPRVEPGSFKVSSRWCLSRYRPFLMSKPFNASEPFKVSEAKVSLLDLANTVCRNANLDAKDEVCGKYIGADLFGSAEDIAGKRRVILKAPKPGTPRDYENFTFLEAGRDQTVSEYLKLDTAWSLDRIVPLRCGRAVKFDLSDYKHQRYFATGADRREEWGRRATGLESSIYIRLKDDLCKKGLLSVELTRMPEASGPLTGDIIINGQVAASYVLEDNDVTVITVDLAQAGIALRPNAINQITIIQSPESSGKGRNLGLNSVRIF